MATDRITLSITTGSTPLLRAYYWAASLFVSVLGIPLFINLNTLELFIRNVRVSGYMQGGMQGIPFPFVGCVLLVMLLSICLYKYKTIIDSLRRSDLLIIVFFSVFLLTALLSEYSFASIIQLILFPVLLWIVSFFYISNRMSRNYIVGIVAFSFLHFTSILYLNSWSLVSPFSRSLVYESFFNYQIYQGLISYVNVLTLAGVGILYFLIKEKRLPLVLNLGASFALVMYVSALSSQRQYAVDLLLVSIVVLYLCFFCKSYKRTNKIVAVIALALVWCLSTFLVNNSAGASAPKRLLDTVFGVKEIYSDTLHTDVPVDTAITRHNIVGMERVVHVNTTLNSIFNRIKGGRLAFIISGSGKVHSGSHNFILDIISGAGILGAIAYIGMLFCTAWRFFRPCLTKHYKNQLPFILLLFSMAGAGSMVNSPLTQPYYFLNLIFVSWFIVSDSQSVS
jgi:low affinity Fe/Cu permease